MKGMESMIEALNAFDPVWYSEEYPDVRLSGMPPLEHFHRYGFRLGRKPCKHWIIKSTLTGIRSFFDQVSRGESINKASNQAIRYRLRPLNDIGSNFDGEYEWISQGNDPYFLLEFDDQKNVTSGWYRADMIIRTNMKRGRAKIYLNTGAGFNEAESTSLGYIDGEKVSRLFRIDKPAREIRFDPKETQGMFSVDIFEFTPVGEYDAYQEMLERLAQEHPDFLGLHPDAALTELAKGGQQRGENLTDRLARLYATTFDFRQSNVDYAEWIERFEVPGLPSAQEVDAEIARMASRPLISVVMPVYNTPEIYLRACIETVLRQSYPNWELCIADDASTKPHVQQMLKGYEQRDQRIRVVYRNVNGHISATSNSALELSTGDYVALLDHDDELPAHALYFVALAINRHPDAHILYSDEDKIDGKGTRFDPHFKSDWNPDLFFSQNYVSHLGVYRRDLVSRIGGFRIGVEGSQDQDLLLRCLPHVRHDHIIHIPKVLYHWRMVEGSTALASGEKSYTTEAGVKALSDYFSTYYPDATVEAAKIPNTYRVRWPIPKNPPLVSLLIPTRDKPDFINTCVRSIIEKTTYPAYEIIILDNGSIEPETLEFFSVIQQDDHRVKVLRYDHPFNYSAINNFGVEHSAGEIIGLINNDIEVISHDWLTEMVGHALRPEIGCVGAKLYYGEDTIQHAGVIVGIGSVAGHSHKYFPRGAPGYFSRLLLTRSLSAVTAACLLVRREVYDKVGGLDEQNLRVAFNDVDFCLKVRESGYRNLWTPYAELYHHESISRGVEDTPEKLERFRREVEFMQKKWGKSLQHDPYYSPNLTREREDFSLSI